MDRLQCNCPPRRARRVRTLRSTERKRRSDAAEAEIRAHRREAGVGVLGQIGRRGVMNEWQMRSLQRQRRLRRPLGIALDGVNDGRDRSEKQEIDGR